ncbi:hypothetical protein [Burkholderia plantarii]|uniref:hypothetical protein n=1 Tax=Burkholderia plantarii TaxID=41899 RepID=UPI00114CE8A2|nr:hypothetical protein [Burkholderia plantarii]
MTNAERRAGDHITSIMRKPAERPDGIRIVSPVRTIARSAQRFCLDSREKKSAKNSDVGWRAVSGRGRRNRFRGSDHRTIAGTSYGNLLAGNAEFAELFAKRIPNAGACGVDAVRGIIRNFL